MAGFVFFTHPDNYNPFLAVLTSAFGAPCRTGGGTTQNAFGATFKDPTAHWCVAEGELELEKYYEANKGTLSFFKYQEPREPKEYTPANL